MRATRLLRASDKETSAWLTRHCFRRTNPQDGWDQEGMLAPGIRFPELLEGRRALGHEVGLATYNVALEAVRTAQNDRTAWALFHDMSAHGVTPDHTTFLSLMRCSASRGDVDGAKKAWKLMRKAGLARFNSQTPPAVPEMLFSALVKAHAASGDPEGAFRIARSLMKVERVKPSCRNIISLVGACSSYAQALQVARWGEAEHGCRIDLRLMNAVLRRCRTHSEIRAFWKELASQKLSPSHDTWHCLAAATAAAGDADGVLEILKMRSEAGAMDARLVRQAVTCLAGAITAAREAGDAEEAARCLEAAEGVYAASLAAGLRCRRVAAGMLQCFFRAAAVDKVAPFCRSLPFTPHAWVPKMAAFYTEQGRGDLAERVVAEHQKDTALKSRALNPAGVLGVRE